MPVREPKDVETSGGGESWERRVGPPALCLTLVPLVLVLLSLSFAADLRSAPGAVLAIANVTVWTAVILDSAARPSLARPDLTRADLASPDPARPSLPRSHPFQVLVLVVPFLQPLRVLPRPRLARTAPRALATAVGDVAVPIAGRLFAAVAAHPLGRPVVRAAVTSLHDAVWWTTTTATRSGALPHRSSQRADLLGSRRAPTRRLALVGVTATAGWLVDRLQEIQRREERTEAAVQGVLEELRSVQARLQVIEQRALAATAEGDIQPAPARAALGPATHRPR